ncbi:MAG: sugar phosphate isomerase/epimerase [Lacunisphaera sp.]|nr:sugar phosphate isomerase/epimerase [Lacunisphaera sp.]
MPSPAPLRRIPLALQLWSVMEAVAGDLAAAAARVAALGFAGVELAGYGNLDARGVRAALADAGLRPAGMHINPARLGEINQIIDEALTLGTKHVTCAFWPRSLYVSSAACERIGERLAEFGANLRSAGLRFSFHNHDAELAVLNGRTVLEWMLGAAAPRDLAMEPDVFWLHHAGYDPARFLREQGARCPLIHLRDEAEIGGGPVDYPEVFAAIDAVASAEWLIVEQDRFNHEPFESLRRGMAQLTQWGRA